MRHPMQQVLNVENVHRFRANKIVCYLLAIAPTDLNELARLGSFFSNADWEQFAQLTGYSVSGFCDLSYGSDETKDAAWAASEALGKKHDKNLKLQKYLSEAMQIKLDGIGGPVFPPPEESDE